MTYIHVEFSAIHYNSCLFNCHGSVRTVELFFKAINSGQTRDTAGTR